MTSIRIIPNFSGTGCIIYDHEGWANDSSMFLIKILSSGLYGSDIIDGVDTI